MASLNLKSFFSRDHLLLWAIWVLATVLTQLSMTLLVKVSSPDLKIGGSEFFTYLPMCLAVLEFPAAYGTFHLLSSNHKESLKWSCLWIAPFLFFSAIVLAPPLRGLIELITVFMLSPTGSLLFFQVIVGSLQGIFLEEFIPNAKHWVRIRIVAFLLANLIIFLALRQGTLIGDLWEHTDIMVGAGLVAGLIKGGGLLWLLQERKADPEPVTT